MRFREIWQRLTTPPPPVPTPADVMMAGYHQFLSQLQTDGGLHSIRVHLALKPKESAFRQSAAEMYETRSVRYSTGGGSTSVRVMKGVSVRSGSTRQSESYEEMRLLDQGVLTLTDQRFVFAGSHENRVIPLAKVLTVKQFVDAIAISVENKAKTVYFFVDNPAIWYAVYQILTRTDAPDAVRIHKNLT